MPWSVLALLYIAIYARLSRGNLLETLGEDYIRTARAKGLSERKVIFRHGLRERRADILSNFSLAGENRYDAKFADVQPRADGLG